MQHTAHGAEGRVVTLTGAATAVELAEQLVCTVDEMNDHGNRPGLPGGFLIQADHVPGRIAEPRSDLGCVGAHGLDDRPAVRHHRVDGRSHAVDHDVDEQ